MLNKIKVSTTNSAKSRTGVESNSIQNQIVNNSKMKEISSLSCGIAMPKQIVLVGTLLAEDTSFVYNDACGLFTDFEINQNLASAFDISGKLKPSTLRNVSFGLCPVIDMITYKSNQEAQLNNDVLFKTVNINGTIWKENIFQSAILERNTQFQADKQTINLRPMEEVVLSSQTGVIVAAVAPELGTDNVTTVIMKVDRWVPWSTALQMFGAHK